jgi:hypothetical protein
MGMQHCACDRCGVEGVHRHKSYERDEPEGYWACEACYAKPHPFDLELTELTDLRGRMAAILAILSKAKLSTEQNTVSMTADDGMRAYYLACGPHAMAMINGRSFHCEGCKANVFTRDGNRFSCNRCGAKYVGEK